MIVLCCYLLCTWP